LEDDDLGTWILGSLKEADVEPGRLGLEITETTAITSLSAAQALATRLTDAGCGFALDDFGAGFGSFSYLKHLPFTAIKIAGEFVRQLDRDPVDRALVSASWGWPGNWACARSPSRSIGRRWSSSCARWASTTGRASTSATPSHSRPPRGRDRASMLPE
jgi:hypothetical protein